MSEQRRGQVITFYSYKGGTGRSMALANVACLLAQRRSPAAKVLVVDWDLEAPGLHRYFRNKSLPRGAEDPDDDKPGLIDLFYELDKKTDALIETRDSTAGTAPDAAPMDSTDLARAALDGVRLDDYILKTEVNSLFLLKAGRFDRKNPELYSARVNTFQWEKLYNKSPKLIRALADRLAERYQYVFIDSRTGITDISGICTMLMPEKLVVVFTPNRQSLFGGLKLTERVTRYRRGSSDLRPLVVFPLVSRVQADQDKLREKWRFGDAELVGYQPEFERALKEAYQLDALSLKHYFDEMQIQQTPQYAYGEEIAVLEGTIEDKFSMRRSYASFASKLVDSNAPWDGEDGGASAGASEESGFRRLREWLDRFGQWLKLHQPSKFVTACVALAALSAATAFALYGQRTVAALERSQAELQAANDKLKEVSSYTSVLDQNKRTIDDLNKKYEEVSAQYAQAMEQRDKAVQDAQDANAQLSTLQSSLDSTRAQLRAANTAATQARADVTRQIQSYNELSENFKVLQAKCRP